MLRIIRIDKVQLHLNVPYELWSLLMGILHDTAEALGIKSKAVHKKTLRGRCMRIEIGSHVLNVGLYRQFGARWLMYSFKDTIPLEPFCDATVLFSDYDFDRALGYGHVKALELVIDAAGEKTEDYLVHLIGTKTSHRCANAEKTGLSYYAGSRTSKTQFVTYDKSQEQIDKGKAPEFPRAMRLEMRIQNRHETLNAVIASLVCEDPFEQLIVVKRADALSLKPPIADWYLFISACEEWGVARALQHFGAHKKTFIKYLRELSCKWHRHDMRAFKTSLKALFPWQPLWETLAEQKNF